MHVQADLLYQKHLLVDIATLQDWAKNEGAILVTNQDVVFLQDSLNETENESLGAVFNEALDNAAAVLVHRVVKDVVFYFKNKATIELIGLQLLDIYEDLLDDVVSIEVEGALSNLVG